MRRFTFLSLTTRTVLLALSGYALIKLSFGTALFIFLLTSSFFYFFRRSNVPFRETIKNDGELFLSPVNGTVESVRQNVPIFGENEIGHEVRISISIWNEKGLYLSTSGEVSFLKATKGRKIPRDAEIHKFYGPLEDVAHTDLTLVTKNEFKIMMRFVDCKWGRRPSIWLKSGDRGRGAACFGYYPFGGTLLIYLPLNSDILVFESERVMPGMSVLAAIKL